MEYLVNLFMDTLGQYISKEAMVFVVSMFPVMELRAGMLVSVLLDVSLHKAIILSYIGNVIPIPFFLYGVKRLAAAMRRGKTDGGWLGRLMMRKGEANKEKVTKAEFIALLAFVAVPLPGTGAYTGSLISAAFDMDYKKSLLFIYIGMAIALTIMSIVYVTLGTFLG